MSADGRLNPSLPTSRRSPTFTIHYTLISHYYEKGDVPLSRWEKLATGYASSGPFTAVTHECVVSATRSVDAVTLVCSCYSTFGERTCNTNAMSWRQYSCNDGYKGVSNAMWCADTLETISGNRHLFNHGMTGPLRKWRVSYDDVV